MRRTSSTFSCDIRSRRERYLSAGRPDLTQLLEHGLCDEALPHTGGVALERLELREGVLLVGVFEEVHDADAVVQHEHLVAEVLEVEIAELREHAADQLLILGGV